MVPSTRSLLVVVPSPSPMTAAAKRQPCVRSWLRISSHQTWQVQVTFNAINYWTNVRSFPLDTNWVNTPALPRGGSLLHQPGRVQPAVYQVQLLPPDRSHRRSNLSLSRRLHLLEGESALWAGNETDQLWANHIQCGQHGAHRMDQYWTQTSQSAYLRIGEHTDRIS